MCKNKVREVIERVNVKRVKVCMHFCAHGGNVGRLNCRNIVYRASCFAENNIGLHADKELQKIGNTDIREGIDIKTEIDKASTQRWKYRQIDKLLDRYAFTIRCIFEKSKETEETVAYRHRTDGPEKLTVREEKMIIREIKKDRSISRDDTTSERTFMRNYVTGFCETTISMLVFQEKNHPSIKRIEPDV